MTWREAIMLVLILMGLGAFAGSWLFREPTP